MPLASRAIAALLLAAGAAAATGGVAAAAPQNDPNSQNVHPTVPGVSQLPVPTVVADVADQASQNLSEIIYAGR